ncbi:MAG: tRNA pseudouridine(38-40) synthase TruA [Nitrospirales bacterium]
MPTFKLTLEYEGTKYAGWQRQANAPTIQATLEAALRQIAQTDIAAIGAGRTDAGVHALGQVVSFRADTSLTAEDWKRALNGVLPPEISVRAAETVADGFHARYAARDKLYEYRILNRRERSALVRERAWHLRKPLDLEAMREAGRCLLGRHDFSSFQGSDSDTKTALCDLRALSVTPAGDLIRIEIRADRFLRQMVRVIVGTLVEVGIGKRSAGEIKTILEAKDRKMAGKTAPPHGLYLVRVDY